MYRQTYQNFSTAAHVQGDNQHLRQGGVQGELHHLPAQRGQGSCVVQGPCDPQLVHRVQNIVLERLFAVIVQSKTT